MLGDVWRWAGTFRNSNKNIGIDRFQIGIELKKLLDDTKNIGSNINLMSQMKSPSVLNTALCRYIVLLMVTADIPD